MILKKNSYYMPECHILTLWPTKVLCASNNVSYESYEVVTDETFFD